MLELEVLFARIDAKAGAFARASGLACPEGCGRCCHSPEVEATVLECLPLARELQREGALTGLLERLRAAPEERRCALFVPGEHGSWRGRCSRYEQRPTLCRLFGFAARRDRHGQAELVACEVHRAHDPAAAARAAELVRGAQPAPRFDEVAMELASLDPGRGAKRLPINAALRLALEQVALETSLGALQAAATDRGPEEDGAPRRPPRPSSSGSRRPRRAA